jgi:hypothetical protein
VPSGAATAVAERELPHWRRMLRRVCSLLRLQVVPCRSVFAPRKAFDKRRPWLSARAASGYAAGDGSRVSAWP